MFKKLEYKIGSKIIRSEALDFSLYIASLGQGLVEPNPCVGAVLFNEETGELKAFGHHEVYGKAHAEVNCLKDIDDTTGLTLIVTLEPCFHFGKTPPCADLVIKKKIKKLIYISLDPNPLVAGKGLEKIRDAGVEVEKAPKAYEEKNELLNHKFFYAMRNEKSYVHLKWAESRDGKTTVLKGDSWITGKESRDHVHYLRAQSQAVLIGRSTLDKDNPSLNVRKSGYEKTLKVIVFDPKLKSLKDIENKNIYKLRDSKDIIYLCEKKPTDTKGLSFLELKRKEENNEWDLKQLAIDLYKKFKIQSVFVEGGSKTLNEFIKQKTYNRISKYQAPHELGENGVGEVTKPFKASFSFEEDKDEDLLQDSYFF